jgi:hypothetical protein
LSGVVRRHKRADWGRDRRSSSTRAKRKKGVGQ